MVLGECLSLLQYKQTGSSVALLICQEKRLRTQCQHWETEDRVFDGFLCPRMRHTQWICICSKCKEPLAPGSLRVTFMDLSSQAPIGLYRTYLNWDFQRLIAWHKFVQWLIGAVRNISLIQIAPLLNFKALHQTRRCTNFLTEQSCISFIKMGILPSFILTDSWTNVLINKQTKYPSGPQQSASTENLTWTVKVKSCNVLIVLITNLFINESVRLP